MTKGRVSRWLREPLLWFALGGGACLALFGGRPSSRHAGGVERSFSIGDEDVARLRADFTRASGRPPGREELADLLVTHASEEILYREAVALGLEAGDPIVRRRLVDRMSVIARGAERKPEPTPDELARHYDLYRHRFARPARVSFEHVFVDARARGAEVNDVARRWLAALRAPGAKVTGDPAPIASRFEDLSEQQVVQLFGEGFARSLFAAPLSSWQGPLSSGLGVHLVLVSKREGGSVPPLAEISKQVRADWLTEQARGTVPAAGRLLPRYRVHLSPEARGEIEGAALAAPLLERAR